jgi:phosphate:Na+ symporter
MTFFDAIALLGGLGMFLYGMSLMGSALEKMASGKTERILQKLTSSTSRGVLLGAAVTALIQSSSATTVIIIGLVNSGVMRFTQAVGVIMGANIGTTVTGQIIRLSDITGQSFVLQLFKPATLAPAAAFLGTVLYVSSRRTKQRTVGQILLGFGILFIGMLGMESAVMPLRGSPWFSQLFTTLQNPLAGILAGTLVTSVLQSSSASIGILQALTATGAVCWGNAIPIILGQNIGTCITGILASVGASRAAKRVAISHVYFNVIGTVLCVILLYGGNALFPFTFWNERMNMGDIANFHTLFNLSCTLFFLPFSNILVRLSEWTVPEKAADTHPELSPVSLDTRLYASPSVAIAQARMALEKMADLAGLVRGSAIPQLIRAQYSADTVQLAQQRESALDRWEVSVDNYLVDIMRLELTDAESREAAALLAFVTEFERIGDYAINVVERAGEVFDKGVDFSASARQELALLDDAVGEVFALAAQAFRQNDLPAAAMVEPLEETIDTICEALRARHIDRLKAGQCSIEAGIIFLEVLTNFERVSDHCSNIAARILSNTEGQPDPHALRRDLHLGTQARYNEWMAHYRDKYALPAEPQAGARTAAGL